MPGKINSLTNKEQSKYLKNTYNVECIILEEEVQHICPLGEQVGITKYHIEIEPHENLAELVQLHWDIQDLMGKTFTLESGASMVLEIVKKAYIDPYFVSVSASCDKNRHMPAKIEVSYHEQ